MVTSLSHYELLGVQPDATVEQIKNAYKAMSKSLHPDKNHFGSRLMQQINAAKDILLDRTTRYKYDNGDLINHQRGRNINTHGSSSHEVRRLQAQLADVQRQLSASERRCVNLQQSQANLKNKVRNLEHGNQNIQHELSAEKQQHKTLQSKMRTIKATTDRLERENQENKRLIDKYDVKMERISRELRDERVSSAKKLADAQEKATRKILQIERSMTARSVCYQCDGKSTSALDCGLCGGVGALHGIWTRCHSCSGTGTFASVDGKRVIGCDACSSKGAREGVLDTTCFKCKGDMKQNCSICFKGKIRGFNLKLCPICNGKEPNDCINCLGRAYVSCKCGSGCKGHGPNQISKPVNPSSLQRTLALGNEGDESTGWKAKFFSRNWDALSLQQGEVKGVFI